MLTHSAAAGGRVSGVGKWTPCVAMCLLSLLSYADRTVLAILSPTILHELHLTVTQYTWAVTAFSLCYMVANPIWGAWMDRVGLFRAALIAVVVWSVASGAHALVAGFAGLCAARAVLGFGEGATFPAGLKTATTLPVEQQGMALGIAYSGGSLGAVLTPLIVVPIAARWGWRAAFGVSMVAGFGWVALWVGLRKRLRAGAAERNVADRGQGGMRGRLNRDLFASCALYGLGAAPLAYGLYAAPLYLARVLHMGQASIGHLMWLPPLAWEAGFLFWGRVSDMPRFRGRPVAPGLLVGFAAAGVVFPGIAAAAGMAHAVALTLAGFCVAMFVAGGFIIVAITDGRTRQPAESAGFLAGFCISGWALATGVLMPVLGKLFDTGHYAASLCGIACVPPVGVLLWAVLRRTVDTKITGGVASA